MRIEPSTTTTENRESTIVMITRIAALILAFCSVFVFFFKIIFF